MPATSFGALGRCAAMPALHCATEARYSILPPQVAASRRSSRETAPGPRPTARAISRAPFALGAQHSDLLTLGGNTGSGPKAGC